MENRCNVHRLGVIDYQAAWRLQDRLAGEIAAGTRPPTLLLLEHPHTYTFGRSGHAENLLWDEAERLRRGVAVHWVDRGGDVTYHGPGQLVGYPLLPLGRPSQMQDGRMPQAGYLGYLRRLEEMLIAALARLGLAAGQLEGLTGVWVQPDAARPLGRKLPAAKIAAIGVKVDARGVSRHGFALNVDPDTDYWQGIIGCGLKQHPVASLADFFDPPPGMERVTAEVMAAFAQVFDYAVVEMEMDGPAGGRQELLANV